MFIYFWDRERQSMNRGRAEREGDTESEMGSRLWAVSTEPDAGLELTDCEIMTWAEVGRLTDWATQAPQSACILARQLKVQRTETWFRMTFSTMVTSWESWFSSFQLCAASNPHFDQRDLGLPVPFTAVNGRVDVSCQCLTTGVGFWLETDKTVLPLSVATCFH